MVNLIINLILDILFGMIPEVLFFTMYLTYTKNIKENKGKLFVLISALYFILILLIPYKLIFYIIFIFGVYGILKILYKNKADKIDIFMFAFGTAYVSIVAYLCFIFFDKQLNNYILMYLIDRVCLAIPFLFKKYFNIVYLKYRNLWNRKKINEYNEKERRPKAITLRNISVVAINLIIIFMNYYFILMIEFYEGRMI